MSEFDFKGSRRQSRKKFKERKEHRLRKEYYKQYNCLNDEYKFRKTYDAFDNKLIIYGDIKYKFLPKTILYDDKRSRAKWQRLSKRCGRNKGKYCKRFSNNFYIRNVDLKEDMPVNIKYKDNSINYDITEDYSKLCIICYEKKYKGSSKIFTNCEHGNDICLNCSHKVARCPYCRALK